MDDQRKTTSLAKNLANSLKLSQRLSAAHTKAILRTDKINAKRVVPEDRIRRTTG